jgi:anti-sigma regulatory factor (Ser/Thr protein kinase)
MDGASAGFVNDCPTVCNGLGMSENASDSGTSVHQSSLEFRPLPTAVPCARLHTRNVLFEWHLSALTSDAELIVSELMTNALAASRPEHQFHDFATIALRLRADRRFLLIEVWDRSPDDPDLTRSVTGDDSDHGRGLLLVEAFSHRWGFERVSAYAKCVWSELLIPAGAFLP